MRKIVKANLLSIYPIDGGRRFVYELNAVVDQTYLDSFSDKLEDAIVTSKTTASKTDIYIDMVGEDSSAADIIADIVFSLNKPYFKKVDTQERKDKGDNWCGFAITLVSPSLASIIGTEDDKEIWLSTLDDAIYFIKYYDLKMIEFSHILEIIGGKVVHDYGYEEIMNMLQEADHE